MVEAREQFRENEAWGKFLANDEIMHKAYCVSHDNQTAKALVTLQTGVFSKELFENGDQSGAFCKRRLGGVVWTAENDDVKCVGMHTGLYIMMMRMRTTATATAATTTATACMHRRRLRALVLNRIVTSFM